MAVLEIQSGGRWSPINPRCCRNDRQREARCLSWRRLPTRGLCEDAPRSTLQARVRGSRIALRSSRDLGENREDSSSHEEDWEKGKCSPGLGEALGVRFRWHSTWHETGPREDR